MGMTKSAKKTYAAMMAELQTILSEMQSGDLDVDQTIARYEQGQALITELQTYLAQAKNMITHRKLEDENGAI